MPSIWTGELMGTVETDEDSELSKLSRRKQVHLRSTTLVEELDQLGYYSGAFTPNPHTSRGTGFSRGFDDYDDFLEGDIHPFWEWMGKRPLLSKVKHLVTVARQDRVAQPWRSYQSDISSWLNDASEPYFLWIFLLEPHTPYLPHAKHRRSSWLRMVTNNVRYWSGTDGPLSPDPTAMMKLYEDAIKDADEFIGWLSDTVPSDTSLIIHSDHGEGFGPLDHGEWGHQGTFYEENIHVPLIVRDSDVSERIRGPVSLTSIYDIIMSIAKNDFDPKDHESKYTLSRTFRPSQIAVRTTEKKYWSTVDTETTDDGSEYVLSSGSDRETQNPSDFTELAEQLISSRLSHEAEMQRVRDAVCHLTGRV
jgi:arylsulfatase